MPAAAGSAAGTEAVGQAYEIGHLAQASLAGDDALARTQTSDLEDFAEPIDPIVLQEGVDDALAADSRERGGVLVQFADNPGDVW